ncbi:PREDICTED: ejaculatory bulb-specific protein 3 [Diuraphis noxia]|uniref:ejaculatory bulb-specific protein 3 n=1 Tax=Diuraphis noxia TaxID=143948 RepID=UPI00076365E6|nr:PREDICTED: ejaculatory bulb-specific protein 3 [Diuraphis noxia]
MSNFNDVNRSPRSRPEMFCSLMAVAAIVVLVHQPAAVYCADGGTYPIQQQQKQPQPQSNMFTAPSGYYISTYDNVDVGRLLRNKMFVSGFIKCFVNEGRCSPEGQQVKVYLLPEIIRTVCGKCTPRQKDMARLVLRHIYTYRRDDFEKIMQIYDTDGKKSEIIEFMNEH